MFLVGGGILTHGVPALHHLIEGLLHGFNGAGVSLATLLFDLLAGVVAGAAVVLVVSLIKRVRSGRPASH
jgi:hypothetical protein